MKSQLRELLTEATNKKNGWSLYAISQQARVDLSALKKFMDDESRDMSLTTAEKLLEFFEVDLTTGKIPKRE